MRPFVPHRTWVIRIKDILDAIEKISEYTSGMTKQECVADEKTIDAVIRNLTIIGEAARHVPSDVRAKYANVPWDEMLGIRNVVVHEYFGVSTDILWETIQQDLPMVAPLLLRILTENDDLQPKNRS
jgi:uncharacterized protein with HEPN domain